MYVDRQAAYVYTATESGDLAKNDSPISDNVVPNTCYGQKIGHLPLRQA